MLLKIKHLFTNKSENSLVQLFRYFFSGGTAFVVDYAVLLVCKEYLGLHYLLATALGFSVGIIITYLFSIFWVFSKRRFRVKRTEFLLFSLIGIIGLLLTVLFMWLFTGIAHFHYLISKIITVIIVFLWNFAAKKRILF
jgi:putative flippase GtrA